MILDHRATYTNTTTGELVSQECLHTSVHRENRNPRSTDTQACRTEKPQSHVFRHSWETSSPVVVFVDVALWSRIITMLPDLSTLLQRDQMP